MKKETTKTITVILLTLIFVAIPLYVSERRGNAITPPLASEQPDLSVHIKEVEQFFGIDAMKDPMRGSNSDVSKEYVTGNIKFWEISFGDSDAWADHKISFDMTSGRIVDDMQAGNYDDESYPAKKATYRHSYLYNFNDVKDLQQTLATGHKVSIDKITLQLLASSLDGNIIEAGVSVNCVINGTDDENKGCAGVEFASKKGGAWEYVSFNEGCPALLDFGVPKEMLLQNYPESACR